MPQVVPHDGASLPDHTHEPANWRALIFPIWEVDNPWKAVHDSPKLGVFMRLLGREKLCCLSNAEERVKKWVQSWTAEVANANWKHPAELGAQFPNVKQMEDGRFLFPVNGCARAISLLVAFPQGIALITSLEETNGFYGS